MYPLAVDYGIWADWAGAVEFLWGRVPRVTCGVGVLEVVMVVMVEDS